MLMTNLHIAWYLLVGPIAGAATLYTYALAVYVLAIGFDRGNPDLFPWLFWGGVFLSIYIPILTDLTDHRNPQVYSYPVLGILLLLSTGVAGLLWAYLWATDAFWLQARYLPWVYDLMTTPWYWGTVGVLSAARVVGALLWAWVVEYKPVYRGAQGLTAREEDGRKEREEEEREVGTVITGHLDPKEAARNPTAEERQAVFWRLRQQLVLPPEAEQEIVELILLLRHHEAYRRQFGSDVPKGVLLVGPQGRGRPPSPASWPTRAASALWRPPLGNSAPSGWGRALDSSASSSPRPGRWPPPWSSWTSWMPWPPGEGGTGKWTTPWASSCRSWTGSRETRPRLPWSSWGPPTTQGPSTPPSCPASVWYSPSPCQARPSASGSWRSC